MTHRSEDAKWYHFICNLIGSMIIRYQVISLGFSKFGESIRKPTKTTITNMTKIRSEIKIDSNKLQSNIKCVILFSCESYLETGIFIPDVKLD